MSVFVSYAADIDFVRKLCCPVSPCLPIVLCRRWNRASAIVQLSRLEQPCVPCTPCVLCVLCTSAHEREGSCITSRGVHIGMMQNTVSASRRVASQPRTTNSILVRQPPLCRPRPLHHALPTTKWNEPDAALTTSAPGGYRLLHVCSPFQGPFTTLRVVFPSNSNTLTESRSR